MFSRAIRGYEQDEVKGNFAEIRELGYEASAFDVIRESANSYLIDKNEMLLEENLYNSLPDNLKTQYFPQVGISGENIRVVN